MLICRLIRSQKHKSYVFKQGEKIIWQNEEKKQLLLEKLLAEKLAKLEKLLLDVHAEELLFKL